MELLHAEQPGGRHVEGVDAGFLLWFVNRKKPQTAELIWSRNSGTDCQGINWRDDFASGTQDFVMSLSLILGGAPWGDHWGVPGRTPPRSSMRDLFMRRATRLLCSLLSPPMCTAPREQPPLRCAPGPGGTQQESRWGQEKKKISMQHDRLSSAVKHLHKVTLTPLPARTHASHHAWYKKKRRKEEEDATRKCNAK